MSCSCQVASVTSDSLRPHRTLLCPWGFPGKNTEVGCHFLLQRIFRTQGSNPHLLSPRYLEAGCGQDETQAWQFRFSVTLLAIEAAEVTNYWNMSGSQTGLYINHLIFCYMPGGGLIFLGSSKRFTYILFSRSRKPNKTYQEVFLAVSDAWEKFKSLGFQCEN